MEKFIFKPDRFTGEVVPRKLDPAEVAKFLLERIDQNTGLKQFIQVEKVAAFYDTYEVAEKFQQFLNKGEKGGEQVRRSIVIARTIARVGEPAQVKFAGQYYDHLVTLADTPLEFEEIILLHDVLRLGGSSALLRRQIEAKTNALEARKDTDDQARLAYLKFDETVKRQLDRAERAELTRQKILGISDRQKRLKEEIKAYLTIEYGFLEYLQPWAAARLRRETWALQPPEQIVRKTDPRLREDVAKAFRDFLGKLKEMPETSDEEKESARLRVLRAVKFFGGKVSESEESFLDLYKGTQADILANEGFLLDVVERR